jgi:hypothetical protein
VNRNNKGDLDRFLNLPLNLYGDSPPVRNSIQKTRSLVESVTEPELYICIKSSTGEPVGRMSICFNEKVIGKDNKPLGQIGLFEVVEDYDVYLKMIDFAKNQLQNCSDILFPIYFSTWYQYRFIYSHRDRFSFFLENNDMPWYSEFTEKLDVKEVYNYKSIISHDINFVFNKNEKYYNRAIEKGFTFIKFEKNQAGINLIYELSTRAFKDNLYYSDISLEEFSSLYSGSLKMIDDDFFTVAVNSSGKPAGFCFSIPDYTPAYNKFRLDTLYGKIRFFLSRKNAKGFIIKTVGVLPEYRGEGLQSAFTYLHCKAALKRKFEYIIGALIFGSSVSPKVLGDTVVEKEYRMYRI